MDPLEKNIEAWRDDLQRVEQPDRLHIWNGITRTPPLKKRPVWPWMAAACVFLLAGMSIGYWWSESRHPRIPVEEFAGLTPELQAQVRTYQMQISLQEKAIRVNRPSGEAAAEELRELQVLDSLQQAFWADFEKLPKDYRTAERCLHYYEQKIRILELVLKEIQIRKHEEERPAQQQI